MKIVRINRNWIICALLVHKSIGHLNDDASRDIWINERWLLGLKLETIHVYAVNLKYLHGSVTILLEKEKRMMNDKLGYIILIHHVNTWEIFII